MNPKKILFVITSISKGGAENHLAKLSILLSKLKYKIIVVYYKDEPHLKKDLNKNGIKVIKLKSHKTTNKILDFILIIYNIFKLRKIFKKFQPDIIHSHLPQMEIMTRFAIINMPIKFIITKHLDNFLFYSKKKYQLNFFEKIINDFIYCRADKIVAISNAVKKYIIQNTLFINKKKIHKIYYGFDFKFKKNKPIKKNKNIYIGSVSRLVYQKRIDLLIRAFFQYLILAKKNKKNIKTILLIAGKGPLKKKLVELVIDLGIKKYVKFVGFKKNIEKFYKQIDLFCLTSTYEGLGLVFLEAMSHNIPIVALKTSAIEEIVNKKRGGFLVKYENDNKIIKNIALLFFKLTKKKPKINVQNNKKFLKKYFSEKQMINKFLKIYN